jgi:ATP-dependent DNA helicase PIF1
MEANPFKEFAYKPEEKPAGSSLCPSSLNSALCPSPLNSPLCPSSLNSPLCPSSLNSGQQVAYDAILAGKSIFLTGPGGTGKSFLINTLYTAVPERTGKKIALTALTGCASLLLHPKAKTIHSWAGIGLGRDPVPLLIANAKKSRKARSNWMTTDVLVIDEVSMMTPDLFEKLDQVGRSMRKNTNTPFGGLQIVLVGDFFQLPPVTESNEISFLFESPLWKEMSLQICELTESVRQKEEVFQKVLEEARRGELSRPSLKILARRMGLDYSKQPIQPTMLFTRRAQVDLINMRKLKEIMSDPATERYTYKATTTHNSVTISEPDEMVQKGVWKLDSDAAYSAELVLAKGAQVMLVTNFAPEKGLVNGSRGVVTGFEGGDLHIPVVLFRNGKELPITHALWEVPDLPGIKRKQIPLRLAYAITIHKAQGSTLDCALIDVGSRTFEVGQAYVALSRVKDLDSLYIHDLDPAAFMASEKVKTFYDSVRCART